MARVRRAILADDMGLGKTLTAILWSRLMKSSRLLVTAPKEVTSNLLTEIAKWTKRPIVDLRGKTKLQREAIISAISMLPNFIVLINLEAWSRDKDFLAGLISLRIQDIIVDEAHHLSNTRTSAFKGVRELVYAVNQCPQCYNLVVPSYKCNRSDCDSGGRLNRFKYCMRCGHQQSLVSVPDCSCGHAVRRTLNEARSVSGVIVMTGTPIINKPADLWSLLHLVNEVKFPTQKKFADTYTVPGVEANKILFKDGAQDALLKTIGRQYIQRSREDAGIRLPPQTVEVLEYERDTVKYEEQWRAYDRIEKSFAVMLEGEELVPLTEIVVQIMRLRQMLTWPKGIQFKDENGLVTGQVNIPHSQKLDIVHDKILEYLECGQRVIAFSHFKSPLEELQRRLGNRSVVYNGDTEQSVRSEIREDFGEYRRHPKWDVLLCNYRSTGESLTLVGASQIVVIDPEWSPSKTRQAYGRVDRIGQEHETRVHVPRIAPSIDIWMAALNDYKAGMSEEFNTKANYQSDILKALRGEK